MERTIWLGVGEEVEFCPTCQGKNVRPCEVGGLYTCEDCEKDFRVHRYNPQTKPKVKAISADDLWEKMHKAGIA